MIASDRAIHVPRPVIGGTGCAHCHESWPCRAIVALDNTSTGPAIRPAEGDPELLADGSIVGWGISSRIRISFTGAAVLITGKDETTERTVTAQQVRRFALMLLAYTAAQKAVTE